MAAPVEAPDWMVSMGAGPGPVEQADRPSDVWFRLDDGRVGKMSWYEIGLVLDRHLAGVCSMCGTRNCWPERHRAPRRRAKRAPLRVDCSWCDKTVYRSRTTGRPEICFDCAPRCIECCHVMTSMQNGGWKCFQCPATSNRESTNP